VASDALFDTKCHLVENNRRQQHGLPNPARQPEAVAIAVVVAVVGADVDRCRARRLVR
jgi:hypothetical protein